MDNGWDGGLREQQAGLISGVRRASGPNEPTARVGALLRGWGCAGPARAQGPWLAHTPFPRSRQNAWISDRTLCYLASGKPVVVQDTGPSSFLPNGEGMFRFSTLDEAANALAVINSDYARHCREA